MMAARQGTNERAATAFFPAGMLSLGKVGPLALLLMLGSIRFGHAEESLVQANEGLFAQNGATLVLPSLKKKDSVVYSSSPGGNHYNHHPFIIRFHGQFYVMWSSGATDEDSPNQRVDYSVSTDGTNWSPRRIFAVDPDGPGGAQRRTAGGWWSTENTLYACFATHYGFDLHPEKTGQKWQRDVTLEYSSSTDGKVWTLAQPMIDDFMPSDPPRWEGKYWLITGESASGSPRIFHTNDPSGVRNWQQSQLPPVFNGKEPNECSWYRRPDGSLIMLFRDDNRSGRLFASQSSNDGLSWSKPKRVDFPDAMAKVRAGNFPDGEAYIISNPSTKGRRIPLALSISRDGRKFDRSYAIRSESTHVRYPGLFKGDGYSYANSTVCDDSLYVTYSINKEDIGVSQIPLAGLVRR